MLNNQEQSLKEFLTNTLLNAPDKQTVIRLRWVVISASCFLLLYSDEIIIAPEFLSLFGLVHVLSNTVLYWSNANKFKLFRFFAGLVLFDTLALSCSLILTGQLGSEFYLTYFLIIIIAGFWQDLRGTVAFGILISLLYTFLLLIAEDASTFMYLRVPFLFASSIFFGYCAQLIRTEHALRLAAEAAARTDFLTGLPNRKAFDEGLQKELNRASRYERALSLLIVDIDNFKSVNDSLGHQWGDTILQGVAGILKHNVRQPDLVARVGGEEFAVVLPETELPGAVQLGDRLRTQIGEHAFETPRGHLVITVSVGATSNAASDGADWNRLYHNADQALYFAKQRGKNRVAVLPGKDLTQQDGIGAH